jgi:1D-myo-inositol 3-kinase
VPPGFVAVGHLTLDHLGGGIRPGGAALYAALAARRLGARAAILTSYGPDFPGELLPPDLEVARVPAPRTTVFRHERRDAGRRLTLLGRAADLEAAHLPPEWKAAELALLCPVANEVDPHLAAEFSGGAVAALVQGWLRGRGAGGLLTPARWEDAGLVLPHLQALFMSGEDVAPFPEDVEAWVEQVPLAVVTLGSRGALLYVNGERHPIAAEPAREVDPTGAGDVFAAAFLLHYRDEGDPWEAARFAACAAALRVEGEGIGALPSREAVAARLRESRRRESG